MVDLFRGLVADKKGMPPLPNKIPSIEKMFASMEFSDLWGEAHMTGVCHYLRSGKYLVILDSFKDLIPKKLWFQMVWTANQLLLFGAIRKDYIFDGS